MVHRPPGAGREVHGEGARLPSFMKHRLVGFCDNLSQARHAAHVMDPVQPFATVATSPAPIMASRVTKPASASSSRLSAPAGRSGTTR